METNAHPVNETASGAAEPVDIWVHTAEEKRSLTLVMPTPHIDVVGGQTLIQSPITAEGEGVRISPRQMHLGQPYIFRFGGTYLIAVKQGEEHVDVYTIPQS